MIDTQGYIRHDHIGEGDYNGTEKAIQSLLAERAALTGAKEISFTTRPTAIKARKFAVCRFSTRHNT